MKDRIDELRMKIVNDEDKILFDEAKSCILCGAYRAAYIVIWIAIAESIKGKFKKMAVRDSEIEKLVSIIEEKEKYEKPTDKVLLDSALKFGLIDKDQYSKLNHIKDMRGVYAHPIGTAPEPEEVLSALVVAVNTILSKPALLRHGYVKELVTKLFNEKHFLDDLTERVEYFAKGLVNRIHPSAYPYLLRIIVEKLEPIINDPSLCIFKERGITFATSFFKTSKVDMSEQEWKIPELILDHPNASTLLLSNPSIWPNLSEHAQDIIMGNLLEIPKPTEYFETPISLVSNLIRFRILRDKNLLSKRHLERFNNAMEKIKCSDLNKAGFHLVEYIKKVIDDLASRNWYLQNPAVETVSIAGPDECDYLDEKKQEELGRNILQAAEGDAGKAVEFITDLSKENHRWPEAFIRGIALETLVNENLQLRFKRRFLKEALLTTLTLPIESACRIIDKVTADVSASTLKYPSLEQGEFEQVMVVISDIKSQLDINEVQEAMNRLEIAINEVCSKLIEKESDEIPF